MTDDESIEDLKNLLESNIGKRCLLHTIYAFRYECKIEKVFGDFLQIYDTKKNFTKVIKINQIREVDFIE